MSDLMNLMRRFQRKRCSGDDGSPKPANDNYWLLEKGESPLEFLLWLDRMRREMREDLAAEPELLTCPKHRKIWRELETAESCFHWQQAQWG